MASQEFLASFAVDIDEAGVSRLQAVLEENRDLANEVAAAFEAATAAIMEYEAAASGTGTGSGTPSGNTVAKSENQSNGTAEERDAGMAGAKKDGIRIPDNPMQNLAQLQLGGIPEGDNAPAMLTAAKELVLRNMEAMFLGQVSRDSGNASREPVNRKDPGLSSDPTEKAGYTELITAARDLLREPVEQARENMKQAKEAEEDGRDGSEHVRMVDEVLRRPLEQVKGIVDHFGFGDEPETTGRGGPNEGSGSPLELDTTAAEEALEAFREKASEPISVSLDTTDSLGEGDDQSGELNMDLTEARADLESFRKEASKPVALSGNASGMVSAARSAYNSIRAMFSTPITITARVEKEGTGDGAGNPSGGPVYQMSSGGRFTKPTDVQVAEDGDAEYIIPVKKEDRALPLLKQLLSELSPAARASLSLGNAAQPLAGGLSAGTATAMQITQNHSNISAPVSIQVHSTGANAEQVGQKLYDTAERYLLRTIEQASVLQLG